MAELFRLDGNAAGSASGLYLRIKDFIAIPAHCRFGLLAEGKTSVHMLDVEQTPEGWKIANEGLGSEYLLHSLVGEGPLHLCIFDSLGESTIFFKTELAVDRSFYRNTTDLARLFDTLAYARPRRLAVFTHAYNEKTILQIFLRYYRQLVDPADIYIVNHGSDPDQIDHLRGEANVVDIPRGETDHYNIAAFCSHFQRFLLTQYDWVIHIDADELLLFENGIDGFRHSLQAQPPGAILRPGHAYELIHDIRSEAPIDLAQPITLQRSLLVGSPAFHKPALASAPTTWTIGFHGCLEPALTMDQMWLIHLRDFDFDHSVARDAKWSALRRSALDARDIPGGMQRPDRDQWQDILLATLAAGETVVKYGSGIGNGKMVPMPDWMRGQF